jgi:hypothetical protein
VQGQICFMPALLLVLLDFCLLFLFFFRPSSLPRNHSYVRTHTHIPFVLILSLTPILYTRIHALILLPLTLSHIHTHSLSPLPPPSPHTGVLPHFLQRPQLPRHESGPQLPTELEKSSPKIPVQR